MELLTLLDLNLCLGPLLNLDFLDLDSFLKVGREAAEILTLEQ